MIGPTPLPGAALPDWQPHPEVWGVIATLGLLLALSARAAPEGTDTSGTRRSAAAATAALVLASCAFGWPFRDAALDGLATAWAAALLVVVLGVAPLLVASVPPWAARRLVSRGGAPMAWLRRATRPTTVVVVDAGALAVWCLLSTTRPMGSAPTVAALLLVLLAGTLRWTAVLGPWEHLRLRTPPGVVVLVSSAVLLLVAGTWLGAGEPPPRSVGSDWDIGPETDIRVAGLLVAGVGVLVIVGIAAVRLLHWVRSGGPAGEKPVVSGGAGDLTTADVAREFDRLGPPRHVEGDTPPGPTG